MSADSHLDKILDKRRQEGRLRELSVKQLPIDFCSNDYLGLARSEELKKRIEEEAGKLHGSRNGATGSRLLSGNTDYAEALEEWLAAFHQAEAALLFNSGYDANTGLFGCIAGRHDTIIYDELSHASIIDGIRLSLASSFKFEHNRLDDLEDKLKKSKGNIYVAVESVYSMEGDVAPLEAIAALCRQYKANLIVDEAHATGVFGQEGKGLVAETGQEEHVFARIHTFGKALGVHGAVVVGSRTLRDYLVNYARSFIYTTALPVHSLVSVRCAYEQMKGMDKERSHLKKLIAGFHAQAGEREGFNISQTPSPIQSIVIPGNAQAKRAAEQLQQSGFDVRPVLSPTVPAGKERLRICLHSFNTEKELEALFQSLQQLSASSMPHSVSHE